MTGAGVVLWRRGFGEPLNVTIMDSVIPLQAKLTIEPGKRGQLVARLGYPETLCAHPLHEIERLKAMWRRNDR